MESPTGIGRRAIGLVSMLSAAALWGTVGPAQVLANSPAVPSALGAGRLVVGGALLALLVRPRRSAWRAALRRDVLPWVLLGVLATGVYQVAFAFAIDHLGAAVGTVIALGVAPAATGLCALVWTGEPLPRGWVFAGIVAVVGTIVLVDPFDSTSRIDAVGVLLALLAGGCYGAYTVATRRFVAAGLRPLPGTAIVLGTTGVLSVPVLAIAPSGLELRATLTQLLWTGGMGTAVAYVLFALSVHRISSPTIGTLSLAEPLIAAGLGIILLGERLSPAAAAGGAVLFVGLLLTTALDVAPQIRRARIEREAGSRPPSAVSPSRWQDASRMLSATRGVSRGSE